MLATSICFRPRVVSTRAVIGQFSGAYSTLHQVFLTFTASKSLKLSLTSNVVY